MVVGDVIRDWQVKPNATSRVFPYDGNCPIDELADCARTVDACGRARTCLGIDETFGGLTEWSSADRTWYE